MGLADFFKQTLVCPECRSRGAVKPLAGGVRCPNPSCARYDRTVRYRASDLSSRPTTRRPQQGSFDPGAHAIRIRYRNFEGEEAEYVADRTSIRMVRHHISVRVAPTGKRIALAKRFITNLSALGVQTSLVSAQPAPIERQILAYHSKRGTTSPRYEELRRRYPDWKPTA